MINQTRLRFCTLQLSSFCDPAPTAASSFCPWPTEAEPDLLFCWCSSSASRLDVSVHRTAARWMFSFITPILLYGPCEVKGALHDTVLNCCTSKNPSNTSVTSSLFYWLLMIILSFYNPLAARWLLYVEIKEQVKSRVVSSDTDQHSCIRGDWQPSALWYVGFTHEYACLMKLKV